MTSIRKRLADWLAPQSLPAPTPEPSRGMRIATGAEYWGQTVEPRVDPFARYVPAPGVVPVPRNEMGRALAFDYALPGVGSLNTWALGSGFSEGVQFLGFAYLAELAQRAEYRRIAELWAEHATRKWIKLRGPDEDRLGRIEAEFKRLNVREVFREAFYTDAVFGRAQIFLDMDRPREVDKVLPADPRLVSPAKPLKAIRVVEPMWSYPGNYASTDPLAPEFYNPDTWYVYGKTVHSDRFVTIIGKPVPDLLKPAYAFGGLSRLQMAKPYVDNWLKARESTSDMLSACSVVNLATEMSAVLQGDSATNLYARADMFNRTRDNRGMMLTDKGSEELKLLQFSLAGMADLLTAAQEQMASVAAIPLSIYLQITPQGLNASSENEIRSFYADVHGYQEAAGRPGVQRILDLVQLSIDGTIDPDVTFEFEPLWETSDVERATMRKTDADRDAELVNAGVVSNEEVRDRMNDDESGPYFGQLAGPAPDPVDETDNSDDTGDSTTDGE
jgi:hypothetical protein